MRVWKCAHRYVAMRDFLTLGLGGVVLIIGICLIAVLRCVRPGMSIAVIMRGSIGMRSAKNDGEGQNESEKQIAHAAPLACPKFSGNRFRNLLKLGAGRPFIRPASDGFGQSV